jgi:hypothetical protein
MSTDSYLYLKVKTAPRWAALDYPEDFYEEFVHEASVELWRSEEVANKDKKTKLASLEMLIVRCGRNDDTDMLSMADAHSGEAEEVASYLFTKDNDDFYDQFDVIAEHANALLIDDMWYADYEPTTEEIRKFVRRAVDQFDVDLVLIRQEDHLLSRHFRDFFSADGPFLIYSKAHLWPESSSETSGAPEPPSEPPPELPKLYITSRGGQA